MLLKDAQYLSLGTFRKNGHCVETPVWFAQDGNCLYAVTNNRSGKVKRLRNSNRCRVAPCTFSGTVTGDWLESSAHLLEATADIKTAHTALRKKYGLQMVLFDCGSVMGGRMKQRSYIQISMPESFGG